MSRSARTCFATREASWSMRPRWSSSPPVRLAPRLQAAPGARPWTSRESCASSSRRCGRSRPTGTGSQCRSWAPAATLAGCVSSRGDRGGGAFRPSCRFPAPRPSSGTSAPWWRSGATRCWCPPRARTAPARSSCSARRTALWATSPSRRTRWARTRVLERRWPSMAAASWWGRPGPAAAPAWSSPTGGSSPESGSGTR